MIWTYPCIREAIRVRRDQDKQRDIKDMAYRIRGLEKSQKKQNPSAVERKEALLWRDGADGWFSS